MKIKWYYQTKDFKFHALKNIKRIEEIADSEKEMENFLDDKICLGCKLKKNFIEILFDEKQIRASINGKDDFIDYTCHSDLITIFNKKYYKLHEKGIIGPVFGVALIITGIWLLTC